MKTERFEDIDAWQLVERLVGESFGCELRAERLKSCRLQVERLARELTRKVYCLTKKPGFVMKSARRSTVNPEPEWLLK